MEPIASRMQGPADRFQSPCEYQALGFDFRGVAWLSGRQQILMSKGANASFYALGLGGTRIERIASPVDLLAHRMLEVCSSIPEVVESLGVEIRIPLHCLVDHKIACSKKKNLVVDGGLWGSIAAPFASCLSSSVQNRREP